jgi:hypothetical protein
MSIRTLCLHVTMALLLAAGGAQAQDIRTERVAFATGTSGTLIKGSITGQQIADYVVNADAGQILSVDMQTSNASAYFNILPAGASEALFIGSTGGNVADLPLSAAGDYVIRVYLMRNAARRDETASYSLAIGIRGPDFADGLAGGPDYWQVSGLGGDALNVRSGPGVRYAVVGKLGEGQVAQRRLPDVARPALVPGPRDRIGRERLGRGPLSDRDRLAPGRGDAAGRPGR